MTESLIEPGQPAQTRMPLAPGDQPVRLRRLRVESRFIAETQGLERQERNRYSNLLWNLMRFERGPKVKIIDLVGADLKRPVSESAEGDLCAVVDFYHGQPSRADLNQVLKFFSVYLLQRARRETSFARQQFLLFKAVDLLRMLSQYATWAAHRDAEALVYGIFDALGSQKPDRFARYRETEIRVYPMMKRVAETPRDLRVRLELGDALVEQTSFFDALVQYDFLRRFQPRFFKGKGLERRQGIVAARMASVFQNVLDHLGKGYGDARKLNNFIDRYNRFYGSRKSMLTPFTSSAPGRADKTAQGLRQRAEYWYRQVLAEKAVPAELQVRTAAALARALAEQRRYKEGVAVMTEANRYWRGIDMAPAAVEERVGYLNLVVELGTRMGNRQQVAWAAEQQREYGTRLEEMRQAHSDYQKRREEIRKAAQDEVPEEV